MNAGLAIAPVVNKIFVGVSYFSLTQFRVSIVMFLLRRGLLPRQTTMSLLGRRPLPSGLRVYSLSLEPSEYHRLADETLDRLTSELEDLLEGNDIAGSDVEYSVLS